jgi:hypothetical protein
MERLKREAARDPEEKRQESLAEVLLKGLGIHPDQPPPPRVEPDDTPRWWEIQMGYKQAPDSPQRDTGKNDLEAEPKVPFLSQRVEDIRGMAETGGCSPRRHGAETTLSG